MTDVAGFQGRTVPVSSATDYPSAPLLTETYWGFVVKNTAGTPAWVHGVQAMSLTLGASFAAASIGIWGVPSMAIQVDSLIMRSGLSVFFAITAYLFIAYAVNCGGPGTLPGTGPNLVSKVSIFRNT